MAAIPYESLLSSDFFKFLVGPEKRGSFIHSSVVACQSQALDKLINGDMREAKERCATWSNVDPETFIRFSQYAYTGVYRAAQRQIREQISPKEFLPSPSAGSSRGLKRIRKFKTLPSLGEDLASAKDKDLWRQFKKLYPDSTPDREPEENTPADEFSDVFISHARLYVFADCYGISGLMLICLRKMRQTFERFNVYEEAIDDAVQLVRFCYEHTISLNVDGL